MSKTILQIRLTPGAKRTGWQGLWNGTHWRVAVQARAVDNKANEALIEFLAKETGVPPKNITITHGTTSRQKTVEILGIDSFTPPADPHKNVDKIAILWYNMRCKEIICPQSRTFLLSTKKEWNH